MQTVDIEDLPMPEWPDTNTNSGVPLVTTQSKASSRTVVSRSRP